MDAPFTLDLAFPAAVAQLSVSSEPFMTLPSRPAVKISLAIGVLMCLPALGLALAKLLFHQDIGGISISVADGGTVTVNAPLVWASLGAAAIIGVGLVVFGVYALSPSKSKS